MISSHWNHFRLMSQMEALSIFYLVIIWKVRNQKARRSNTIVMLTKVLCLQFQHFKQLCVEQSLPWLTWRQCVNTVHPSQSELGKQQIPSDPRRTENDIHNNPKKDDQSENWYVLCGSDGVRFAVALTATVMSFFGPFFWRVLPLEALLAIPLVYL